MPSECDRTLRSTLKVSARHYGTVIRGREQDIDQGQKFFAEKFKVLVKDPKKEVYVHYTNATDTTLLKVTMRSVQDMIVQRNLNNLIL